MKQIIGALLLAGLFACQTPVRDMDTLTATGVSKELAVFRKEYFKEVCYRLSFSIPEQRELPVTGKVCISLSLQAKEPVIIDFRNSPDHVSSVELNGKKAVYECTNEHITLSADQMETGTNEISVSFTAADQSLNRREDFLYTLLVPDRARTLFPCFDQPDLKALFTLQLEVPEAWEAVSNGKIDTTSVTITSQGRKQISFNETEPLSTYLFSFATGLFTREKYRDISIYHRATDPKHQQQCPAISDEVMKALHWLEDYTGIPYPFAKYDCIILPGFQYGGMEHTGATLYNDRRMFLDEYPTLNEQLGRSSLIAHETAHMWFGDFVTMQWFDDVWTKEVFANYFASQMVEPLFPEVNHRLNFLCSYFPSAYAEDRTAGTVPIQQPLDNLNNAGLVYGNIVYTKSPVVMDMLTRILGKEAFRDGIREYLKTYAYGNATWDGLVHILDTYTDQDLEAWSQVWVHEKGMPEISAEIKGDSLIVTQFDPLGRGLCWPQELLYRITSETGTEDIPISFGVNTHSIRMKLKAHPGDHYSLLPNADGRGYGFFRMNEQDANRLLPYLTTSADEVLKGSVLIMLQENLLQGTVSSEWYMQAMLNYLPTETNSLLFSMALGYIGNCHRLFPEGYSPENTLWKIVTTSTNNQHRLQAFRSYRSIAESPEAIQRLYLIWKERKAPVGCSLSETDYIDLSYKLVLYKSDEADAIVATQQARLTNPDKIREYTFISPSISPRKADRDSVFASLLIAENRRVEPWAATALAYLNCQLRQQDAVSYIRPGLEALPEIQRTGDIFFPSSWVRALLSGHNSKQASREVVRFFTDHPDFSPMLANKIRQQADHFRVKKLPSDN